MKIQVKFENEDKRSPLVADFISAAVKFTNGNDGDVDALLDIVFDILHGPALRNRLRECFVYRGGHHVAVCSGNDRIALIGAEDDINEVLFDEWQWDQESQRETAKVRNYRLAGLPEIY